MDKYYSIRRGAMLIVRPEAYISGHVDTMKHFASINVFKATVEEYMGFVIGSAHRKT